MTTSNNKIQTNLEIIRGTILMVDLPQTTNSVQGGSRPVLVISNNKGNKFSPVLITVPLTSKTKKEMITHYSIKPSDTNGLAVPSTALCEQIITVGKDSVKRVLGILDDKDMHIVNNKIKASLALF